MSTIIKVENLGKKYILGTKQAKRDTLREVIMDTFAAPFRHLRSISGNGTHRTKEFWALKDVSFEVQESEVVGIIGRNGAGKSTLLKIISKITDPTEGKVKIRGRVASLLEVGTGFHPELTGRENIYLNGAILGMRRAEINKKFDEIVEFSEIEGFLDTPVKRYSSGMYVRLAFAVAAHLEPEILIVDEVLSVGDVQFQKKCLGKMRRVSSEGRTVLFVSHNMNAVEQLCNRALFLDQGRIKCDRNDTRSVIKDYLFGQENGSDICEWSNLGSEYESECFKPLRFAVSDERGHKLEMPVSNNAEIWIQIECEIKTSDPALTVGYAIYTEDGQLLYWSYQTDETEDDFPRLTEGNYTLRSRLPKRLFNEGTYKIELIASLHYRKWLCKPGVSAPSVYLTIQGGLSDSPYWMAKRPGVLAPVLKWSVLESDSGKKT
jgi:lipopolysaccharide transport system ATP-binding protein